MISFNPSYRRRLFMEMASRPRGTTVEDVATAARDQGDEVTPEAYHNLGRRMAHEGLLRVDKSGTRIVYFAKADSEEQWIDEDFLHSLIDPDHPVESLTVARELSRQLRDVPWLVWRAASLLLQGQDARKMFVEAIAGYSDDLVTRIQECARLRKVPTDIGGQQRARQSFESGCALLVSLCRFGLGLSRQAILIPNSLEGAIKYVSERPNEPLYDLDILQQEIEQRIEAGPLIREVAPAGGRADLYVAGVDGSVQGGLLSVEGTSGDFAFGASPLISLHTSAAVLNQNIERGKSLVPVFLRLPERPEDIQRADNRYTVMAKMFFPDMSEAEYMHSTWNAMDTLECRASLRALSRWHMQDMKLDVRPADIVIRDGTVVPNDRDPNHYAQRSSYGRIVQEMMELNWKMAQKCRDDSQTVAGCVKNAQLRVFGPVINFLLTKLAGTPETEIRNWPLEQMNELPDQALVSRLLAAGRPPGDPWLRTAVVLRPFHAVTPMSRAYDRTPKIRPGRRIEQRIASAKEVSDDLATEEQIAWKSLREKGDPYIQLLDHVWYAGFFLCPAIQIDKSETLPRLEFVVPCSTEESGNFPVDVVTEHYERFMRALRETGFDVAKDHDLFDGKGKIDFAPNVLLRAHEVVSGFARELRDRVKEYMDVTLARELKTRRAINVNIRPWKRSELELWRERMVSEQRANERAKRIGGVAQ